MILPMSLTVPVIAQPSRHLWRKLFAVSSLAIVHFVAYFYCHMEAAFSGPWFPFRFNELPEHGIWEAFVGVLQFPLGTIAVGTGLEHSAIFDFAIIFNSLLWAVGIYLLARWVVRSIAARRAKRAATA